MNDKETTSPVQIIRRCGPPLEDLTNAQFIQRYKELEAEFGNFKSKTAEEKAATEKAHAEAVGKLEKRYAELEQKQAELENKNADLKALHATNPNVFLADYTHIETLGLHTNKAHPEWGYFCGGCLPKGIAAQMRKCEHGWQCNGCQNYIEDPANPRPPFSPPASRHRRFP